MDMRIVMKESFIGTGGTYDIDDKSIITAMRNAGINSFKDMNCVRNAIFNCIDNESKEILINLMNRYDYGGDCTICIDGHKTNLSIYKLIDLLSMFAIKDGEICFKCNQHLFIGEMEDILLLMKYIEGNKNVKLDFYHEDGYEYID